MVELAEYGGLWPPEEQQTDRQKRSLDDLLHVAGLGYSGTESWLFISGSGGGWCLLLMNDLYL